MSGADRHGTGRTPEEEAGRELEFHVQMKTDELVAAGWEVERARREAERRFGDIERVRSTCAAIDGRRRRMDGIRLALSTTVRDLRMGVRVLSRRPGFSLVAIFTLALGIGANAAIFSVVNAVLMQPLPYSAPDRLVAVWESHPQRTDRSLVTPGNFLEWRDGVQSMEQLAAYRNDVPIAMTGGGEPIEVTVSQTTPNLFAMLGVRPVLGRLFESPGGPMPAGVPGAVPGWPSDRVVLMSHALWRTRFGADPGVVGSTVELDGTPFEVVGVLPPDFAIPSKQTDVWVPLPLTEGARQQRRSHMYAVVGRLQPDVTIGAAQAEMTSLAARIAAAYPENMEGWTARVTSLRSDIVRDARSPLLLLLGAVALVLLIACANVSNLLFARGVGREREVAVRAALGARRSSLIRQFLAESLLLATIGGVVALLVAWPAVRVLVAMAPAEIPLIDGAGIDGAVLGFGMLVVVATTVLFGILPALRASQPRVERTLSDSRSRGTGRQQSRIRRGLVISEVAFSMLLVTGAALLARSMAKLRAADTGYDMEHVLAVSLSPSVGTYSTRDSQLAFYDALMNRLRALPAVQSVAGTSEPPVVGYAMTFSIDVEGRPDVFAGGRNDHYVRAVTDGWFETAGQQIVAGRSFDSRDGAGGMPVAIINESMAKLLYPGGTAIGRRISASENTSWAEIVGVVADARHFDPAAPEGPVVYIPYAQKAWAWLSWMTLAIRTGGEPAALVPAIRQAVWELDSNLPIQRAVTIGELFAGSLASRRFTTTLLGIFAGLALVLGIIGLYGVIAFGVAERTREIGVRLALGASPRRVVAHVFGEGIGLAGIGIVIGLTGAMLLRGTIRGMLFDTSPFDPLTIGAAAASLLVAASAASLIPALRAVRVDPASTLRSD